MSSLDTLLHLVISTLSINGQLQDADEICSCVLGGTMEVVNSSLALLRNSDAGAGADVGIKEGGCVVLDNRTDMEVDIEVHMGVGMGVENDGAHAPHALVDGGTRHNSHGIKSCLMLARCVIASMSLDSSLCSSDISHQGSKGSKVTLLSLGDTLLSFLSVATVGSKDVISGLCSNENKSLQGSDYYSVLACQCVAMIVNKVLYCIILYHTVA